MELRENSRKRQQQPLFVSASVVWLGPFNIIHKDLILFVCCTWWFGRCCSKDVGLISCTGIGDGGDGGITAKRSLLNKIGDPLIGM